jgi:hypothetical protein
MQLNNELITLIEESGLNVTEALIFCFATHYKLDMDNIVPKIITEDNEMFYRINLLDRDIETNSYILKTPLFSVDNNNDVFIKLLDSLKQNGFTSNGHPNNQIKYSVIDKAESTKNAFNRFYNSDIEFDRLVDCIISYYERTEMPVKLERFFDTIAELEYEAYVKTNNFI